MKLARCFRAGELTKVWVRDPEHEALRDLVRVREAASKDQLRARHRMSELLLRTGGRPADGTAVWGFVHMHWMRGLPFEHAVSQASIVDYLGQLDHIAERIRRLERGGGVASRGHGAELESRRGLDLARPQLAR